MPRPVLLSRTLDPVLGIFTGFLAYYLHETNPRTAPPPGHTLKDLLAWQWGVSAAQRDQRNAAAEATDAAEFDAVRRELEAAATAPPVVEVKKVVVETKEAGV
ncbi:hypothetical protein Q8F55_007906 [Vanrija albida]|uniref:Uncharacterized protein n=1 Tax=Vanrija albida TaxID=181172 RepID=A0ABR3PUS8_9TREE